MLQHDRHIVAHRGQADFLERNAAEPNLPRLRLVKPQQQLHQGALATAAGTDDRDLFPRRDAQVQPLENRFVLVGEVQVAHIDRHRRLIGEWVATADILRLVGARQQLIDPPQRPARRVERVLQAQQLLHRPDHEPQVAEYREHLADRQVGKQHGQHRRGTEHVDAELEQQTAGAVGGVGLPLRSDGVIADLPRA